jgi:hypothetical protein
MDGRRTNKQIDISTHRLGRQVDRGIDRQTEGLIDSRIDIYMWVGKDK